MYVLTTANAQTAPLLPNYGFGSSGSDPYQFPRPVGLDKAIGLDSRNGSTFGQFDITWIDPSLKSSYTPSWYFGVQQMVSSSMSLDVNYVGNTGRKLYAKYNVNRFPGDLTQPGLTGLRQRINPSFGTISYGQSNFTSSYNGLNVTLRKRMTHGLLGNIAYTYGHAISLADTFGAAPTDAWNLELDRGATGVQQKVAASFIYEIPRLGTMPVYLKAVTNGWQLSGVFTATSGNYFTVNCGSTPLSVAAGKVNYGCDYNADGQTGDRPNAPAFGHTLDLSRDNLLNNGIFKISDFPAPAAGLPGNLSKDFFRGLPSRNLDLAVSREFGLPWFAGEKARLRFRAEAFNAPNRVNLGSIGTTMSTTSTFGKVTSASNPRRFQMSLRLSF